jgi:uncharacterized membrane protein
MKNNSFFLIITFCIITLSCSYTSEKDLMEQINPTELITYSEKIKPIFDSNCISCHSSPPINGSGISLTTYNSVKSSIENTNLIDRINWQPGQSGFMPLGGSRLPQNLIDLIIQWQLEGFIE